MQKLSCLSKFVLRLPKTGWISRKPRITKYSINFLILLKEKVIKFLYRKRWLLIEFLKLLKCLMLTPYLYTQVYIIVVWVIFEHNSLMGDEPAHQKKNIGGIAEEKEWRNQEDRNGDMACSVG